MSHLTQAQKLIALRETSLHESQELSFPDPFALTRTQCQREGRARILDEVVTALSGVTGEMKPEQVQHLAQPLLKRLAERKAACLAFYHRNPMRHGIDCLDEWRAEGEIQQINEIWTSLCACFSPRWQALPWKHGCHFQVYHYLAERAFDDAEAIARWKSEKRSSWFWEVAIIEVAPVMTIEQRLEEVFRLTNHIEENWTQGNAVFWVRSGMPMRSTSRRDVVVSVLSGSAWMVDLAGFQPLQ